MLLRNPGFSVVAVLALAIGIGANTAIFSVVDAVLLRPLPYTDPDRLVMIWETNYGSDIENSQVSPVTYTEWVAQEQLFEQIAGWWYPQINVTDDRGDPERARTIDVTDRFFDVLGVDPILGRRFAEGEDLPGAEPVVVIGHGLWQRRFGGDVNVLGTAIRLDNQPHTIIGVAPSGFDYPEQTEVWRPLGWNPPQHSRSARFFEVVARLRPGLTVTQARADITALGRRLEDDYPDSNLGWGALVVPLHEQLVGDTRPALFVLLGAVGFVLLIACANGRKSAAGARGGSREGGGGPTGARRRPRAADPAVSHRGAGPGSGERGSRAADRLALGAAPCRRQPDQPPATRVACDQRRRAALHASRGGRDGPVLRAGAGAPRVATRPGAGVQGGEP